MSNKIISQLAVLLKLKAGGFSSGMKKSRKQTKGLGHDLDKVKGAAIGLSGKLLGMVGVGAGLAGITAGIASASDRIDGIAKTSDKLGIATDKLVGIHHAAQLTGNSITQTNTALQRMVRRVAEAAQGTGTAKNALKELGISAQEMNRLAPDQQFERLAGAMGKVGTKADRVRLAMGLFDTDGVGLVNTLALGVDGLRDTATEAEKLGISLSRVDAAKVEMANDAMFRLKQIATGVFNQLSIQVAPIIVTVAEELTGAATAGDGLGATMGNMASYGAKAVGFLANAWQGLKIIFKATQLGLTKGLGWVLEKVNNVIAVTKWLATITGRVGTFMSASWDGMGHTFALMGNGMKVVFAKTVRLISNQIGDLIKKASDAAYLFDAELGSTLLAGYHKITVASGAFVGQAETDFAKAGMAAYNAAEESSKAWNSIFTVMPTGSGSDTISNFVAGMAVVQETQQKELNTLRNQSVAADAVWQGYQRINQAIQERAVITAEAAALSGSEEDPVIAAEKARQSMLEEMAKTHQGSLTGIWYAGLQQREKFVKQSSWAQVKDVFSSLETMTRGVAQHSKTMFKINQVAGIANAIINTAQGATKALAAYPPPLGPIMAGLVVAAGASQIMAIKNTSFGGGGSAPSIAASIAQPSPSGGGVGEDSAGGDSKSGQSERQTTSQALVIQGDFISAEYLERISQEAKERNIMFSEIRRG